ncbi:MAG: UDP-2,4-diacetamido-2,4,6-trideoxy-beta-L-altropyranose hydrolase [Bacteroidia bacterium]
MRIILRADGNSTIGFGHVYRLLALADILKDKFEIVFAINRPEHYLISVIKNYVHDLIELTTHQENKLPALRQKDEEIPFELDEYITGNEIVVLDGYWFGVKYQKAVKHKGSKLVCIDDLAENYFYADAIINHAPGMKASQYKGETYTKYYLGLDYAMLRKDFFKPFNNSRQPDSLLISMGGADQYRITENVLESAILSNSFKTIHLLISSAFSVEALERMNKITKNSSIKILTYKNLAGKELVELMDNCLFALVSASTVLLECYSRGITCFTGYYTNNQLNIYNGFVLENRCLDLGDLTKLEPKSMGKKITSLLEAQKVQKSEKPLQSDRNIEHVFSLLC